MNKKQENRRSSEYNFFPKNRKAAMEMSVGTIVTVVLLMAVLILGIFLVQKIFGGSSDAIDSINNQVIDEINSIFDNGESTISVAPNSRSITLDKGDDTPRGFAFSVRNPDPTVKSYTYSVESSSVSNCGGLTKEQADVYVLGGDGEFDLAGGERLAVPMLVKFDLPSDAPPCTITYNLNINNNPVQIYVTIK